MNKFNVKYTTNTNLMIDTLTTKCVRIDTAISRFCRFLSDYDTSFKESLLIASMTVRTVGYVDGALAYQAVTETDDYYMTLSGCNGIWTVTIEFKHDENTKHYRSISHPEFTAEQEVTAESEQTEEQTAEEQSEAEATEQTAEEQSEAEQTTEQNEANTPITEQPETTNTYKDYIVRAFENGKELTVQCPFFNKREYAIDYIQALSENGVVSRDVVFTINNSDIYNCFSDTKLTGTTAQIKYATDILNEFYKRLCNDIAFEYKVRVDEDMDVESKDYYANLNTYVSILKKVLNGNHAKNVITNHDKFEVWGNVYRTATNFILSYDENKPEWVIKHLESKMRKELFKDIQILF